MAKSVIGGDIRNVRYAVIFAIGVLVGGVVHLGMFLLPERAVSAVKRRFL